MVPYLILKALDHTEAILKEWQSGSPVVTVHKCVHSGCGGRGLGVAWAVT